MPTTETKLATRVEVNVVDCRPGDWRTRLNNLHDVWPRGPQAPRLSTGGAGRLFFARWTNIVETTNVEFFAESGSEDHILFFPLREWDITCNIGGKTVLDHNVYPGDILVLGADTARSRSIYGERFDVFRITIQDELLREGLEAVGGREPSTNAELFGASTINDPMLQHLAMSLFAAGNSDIPLGSMYADCIGLALSARIAARYHNRTTQLPASYSTSLAPWRLKRVVEYVEANVAKDIQLAELSAVAGLSRMYFAAQFRAATGKSPHTFILERRISAARSLLLDNALSIKAVAAATGFKSHNHFIRAFRRCVGTAPGRWRAEASV